jgi:hypothetical protein
VGDLGVESDFYAELAPAAQAIAQGEMSPSGFPFKGPLHPTALVVVNTAVGDWYRSGIVLNLICAAVSILLLARLLAQRFGQAVGWGAVLFLSLVGEFFLQSHKASSDLLFFLLFYTAVALTPRTRFVAWRFVLVGFVSGLAFLTRYNGLITPIAAVMVVLLLSEGWTWQMRAGGSALLIAGFLVTALPWVIWTVAETGHPPGHRNLQNVVEAFYPGAGGRSRPEGGFSSVWHVVTHDPPYFVTRLAQNVVMHYWHDTRNLLGAALGLLSALGLLRWCFARPSREQVAFLLFPAASFMALLTVFHLPRFSLPVLPLYCLAASGALFGERLSVHSVARHLWRRRSRRGPVLVAGLVASAVVVLQVRIIWDLEVAYYRSCPFYVPRAAAELRTQALRRGDPDSMTVMARTAHIAHYAGLSYQRYPLARVRDSQILPFAIERDVDFVVYGAIERRYFRESRLLGSMETLPGVERVADHPRFILYEITPAAGGESDEQRAKVTSIEDRIAAATAAGDPQAALVALSDLARHHSARGRWDLAIETLDRALAIADRLDSGPDRDAHRHAIHRGFMRAYYEVGDHERGVTATLAYLDDPIDKHPRDEANARGVLGRHYTELGRTADAIEQVEASRDLYAALGDSDQVEVMENVLRVLRSKLDRR